MASSVVFSSLPEFLEFVSQEGFEVSVASVCSEEIELVVSSSSLPYGSRVSSKIVLSCGLESVEVEYSYLCSFMSCSERLSSPSQFMEEMSSLVRLVESLSASVPSLSLESFRSVLPIVRSMKMLMV